MSDVLSYEIRGTVLSINKYPLQHYHQIRSVFTYMRLGFDRETNRGTRTAEIVASGYDRDGNPMALGPHDLPAQIVSFSGYEQRLRAKCHKLNIKVVKRVTPTRDPKVYVPHWENVPEGFEWRYMQKEAVNCLASSNGGIIVASAGYGKSTILGILPRIFPEARILISTFRKTVQATIAEQVKHFNLPGTKYFIQGDNKVISGPLVKASRIVVCGNKSLGKVLSFGDDYDFYCADEVHSLAADASFQMASAITKPRMFGFTASPNRSDGGQFRLLGLFGPRLLTVETSKAVEKGIIVPVEVQWCPVSLQYDPTMNCHHAYRKHRGIWYNALRNKLVAGAARLYDKDVQVLIIVDTIKHGVALRELLPEFFLASAETPNLAAVRGAFKKGTMKKIIATGVFKEGVDFKKLEVLINATGVKSDIANIQIAGRVARTSDGKAKGIVHDFFDTWNPEFAAYSRSRKKLYEQLGYEQSEILPSTLLQQLKDDND